MDKVHLGVAVVVGSDDLDRNDILLMECLNWYTSMGTDSCKIDWEFVFANIQARNRCILVEFDAFGTSKEEKH